MLALLAILILAAPAPAEAGDWAARARALRLSEDRYWRLLLHHEWSPFGSASGVRNPAFFLSPRGRRDPSAELDAFLEALASPRTSEPDRDIRCRFPLRSRWLGEKLGLGPETVAADCPKYREWRKAVNADSVVLIFASAYLNNPSSMYGHTFLRLNQKAHLERDALLDYSVNFSANADTDNGLLFAVYGLVGRFPAGFSVMPYYLKVQEYTNMESRDLWEYRLNLDAAAVDRLAQHLWELDNAEFSYFFFNRNCSYQLLPLLEIADPRLRLTDHYPLYVIPADTLRAMARQPGLLGEAVYRPSRVTTMYHRRAQLSAEEARLAKALAAPKGEAAWSPLAALPEERRARVLDSSADYLGALTDFHPKEEERLGPVLRRVLVARGRIPIASPAALPALPERPERGHKTARASVGYGFADRRFLEADLRLALHDLLDPLPGYARDSALEMLSFRLRHDFSADRNYLHAADLVRILSISPYDPWIRHPSWKVDTGWRTADELDPRPWKAGYYGLGGGSGMAYETHLFRREVAYVLGEADSGAGGIFRRGFRLGAGATAAWVLELAPRVMARLEAGDTAYFGDGRPVPRASAEASWGILRDLAVRAKFERRKRLDEAMISLQGFF